MEEDQELRFVCKLCNKRCPSGKSLGGHMRAHVIANSVESDEKFVPKVPKMSSWNSGIFCKDSSSELGEQSGYVLRENPKKTWRAVSDSKILPPQLLQEQICKQCGKGFQSLKALCGHMACHSAKERILKDDHSWISENQKLVMDGYSDTEAAEAPRRPRRAASMRYKRIDVKSFSVANGSSSVSDVDHEQEEVAMCLMMLSRDSGNWVRVNSAAESSGNNSVVLETKSSSIDMRIRRKRGLSCVYDGDEKVGTIKLGKGKLKSGGGGGVLLDDETARCENSDSGYFMNGPKKVDSDVSVDGFLTNDNFKKQKVESGSRFKVSDAEFGKGTNNVKCRTTAESYGFSKEKGYNEVGIAMNSTKYDSSNRTYNPELCEGPSKKKIVVQDLSCNGERRLKGKRNKGHECPICHKVFKSGQALGGHKRSHFLGGYEGNNSSPPPSPKQELSEPSEGPDLLDLNLPAPEEDEENEHAPFMPW